jgi:hypothetical protein
MAGYRVNFTCNLCCTVLRISKHDDITGLPEIWFVGFCVSINNPTTWSNSVWIQWWFGSTHKWTLPVWHSWSVYTERRYSILLVTLCGWKSKLACDRPYLDGPRLVMPSGTLKWNMKSQVMNMCNPNIVIFSTPDVNVMYKLWANKCQNMLVKSHHLSFEGYIGLLFFL